ncbi:hypothetical protein [uncultured Desulfosarcina sp.]|uniref:hypothetical protein n=1 Tax=uncultured Desulfosarcina sp. TaxID=218289 RepID=UPI0029C8CF2F|nr:hypothetical protein [uncultured Desulfosarcina sp.]
MRLPEEYCCLGVVRQQLLVSDDIPYTSHNSSACLIADIQDASLLTKLIEEAVSHIMEYAAEGSDPGLCVATEKDAALDGIVAFGQRCTHAVSTQKQALHAARKVHLSGHGGTNDGIIGATAAVGLTLSGWSGRYVEFTDLRNWPERTTIAELNGSGIGTLSTDRDAKVPSPNDVVFTHGWLRPRLVGHRPVLFVKPQGESVWENIDRKRRKKDHPTSFDKQVEETGLGSPS